MNAIVGWADDSHADTLAAFVAELDERIAYQVEPDKAGVELATIHAAKGLEWDAVFLVGLSEGLLPISYAKTPEAREEERLRGRHPRTRSADAVVGALAGR